MPRAAAQEHCSSILPCLGGTASCTQIVGTGNALRSTCQARHHNRSRKPGFALVHSGALPVRPLGHSLTWTSSGHMYLPSAPSTHPGF